MITKNTELIVIKDFQTPYHIFKYGDKSTVMYFADKFGKTLKQFLYDLNHNVLNEWFIDAENFIINEKINKIVDIIVSETDIRGIELTHYRNKFIDTAKAILSKVDNTDVIAKLLALQRYEMDIEHDEEDRAFATSTPASYGDYVKYDDILSLIDYLKK